MSSSLLLLLALAAALATATRDVSLALRQGLNDDGAYTAMVYAGHPLRGVPLRVVLGSPPLDVAAGMTGSAQAHDLAGTYSGLYLPAWDPLALRELVGGGADPTLDLPPRLTVKARGATFPVWSNASTTTLAATFGWDASPMATRWRGALVLAPGSSAWLQWRYATITATQVRLSSTVPPPAAQQTALQCGRWDERGRCVLAHHQTLVLHYALGRTVTLRGIETVLDMESATGVLPRAIHTELMHGRAVRTGHIPTDQDLRSITWTAGDSTPVLATLDDTGDGDSNNAPLFVAAGAAGTEGPGQLVIGRRALQRLFTSLTFDSASNTWIATVAVPVPEGTRWALAVIAIIQAALLARFHVSALNVRLVTLLTRPYTAALDRRQLFYALASAVLAVVSAALAYDAVGDPSVTEGDPALAEPLSKVALALVILVPAQIALFILAVVLIGPRKVWDIARRGAALTIPTLLPSPTVLLTELLLAPTGAAQRAPRWPEKATADLLLGMLHASAGALGLLAALLPMATLTMVGLLVFALAAVLLVAATQLYQAGCLMALTLVFARWRNVGPRLQFTLVMMLAFQAAVTALALAGCHLWVLTPLLQATNVLYEPDQVASVSATGLELLALGTAFILVCEAALLKRRQRDMKKRV